MSPEKKAPCEKEFNELNKEFDEIITKLMIEDVATLMALPENFEARNAKHYLRWSELLVSVDKVDDAKSGLKELIQRGHYVGEANLALGRIEYETRNYSLAAKFFKRAQKRHVTFTLTDHEHFAESLFHDKQFKTAAKQQNFVKRRQ